MTDLVLPDALARARVAADLERSMMVVAGAGTGKTTALVERVVALVGTGTASPTELAVITFTEAAAAELRARLRALGAGTGDPAEVERITVCTLHAFARRILTEHALAAGIPPGFEVLDAVADRADFEAWLTVFVDQLLDDPGAEPMLLRALVLGLDDGHIGEIAWCLRCQWDRLVGTMDTLDAARPGPSDWPRVDVGPVLDALDRAGSMAAWCTAEDDLLLGHLRGRMAEARHRLAVAAADEQALLPLLARLPAFATGLGRLEHWDGRIGDVRAACAAAEQERQAVLDAVRGPVVAELLARVARATLDDAARRARQGRLTFHDLLVQTRRLVSEDAETRAFLRRRYRMLLIDEFQDVDPLQVELAGWLASAVDGDGDLARTRPGALFVVGDPTQSLYRFRRADIELFESVGAAIGDRIELVANFRSVPGILRFVDAVFSELLPDEPGDGQAAHRRLVPTRAAQPVGVRAGAGLQLSLPGMGGPDDDAPTLELPPVVVLGGPLNGTMGEVRRSAARDMAAAVRRAVAEGWSVSDPGAPRSPGRPARWRDIALLIPARSALGALEEALDDAAVPYRLEGAALLWGSDDVGDVLSTLAAADDPTDSLAVLAALRSPGLGCGDDDLVVWHRAGGSFDPTHDPPPEMAGSPVGAGLAVIARLHEQRLWREPSELVRLAMGELRSVELAFAHRRPRDHWHRLRWLAEQARAFDESRAGSLTDFLRWAELQRQGDGRSSVLGPPEEDDDAVRVMTVHGSKGLEFPIVVVAGLERAELGGHRADAVLWTAEPVPEVRAGPGLRSGGYDAALESARALDRLEHVRLLYVAMTRSRDHLVLALHHRERNGEPDDSLAARLLGICRRQPLLWRRVPGAEEDRRPLRPATASATSGNGRRTPPPVVPAGGGLDPGAWLEQVAAFESERAALLGRLSRWPVVDAGALAGGAPVMVSATGGPRLEDPPDSATGIGRAVRDVLAAVDLSSGRDASGRTVEELVPRIASGHGVTGQAATVAAMVRAALVSEVVGRAAIRAHHKELSVVVPITSGEAGVLQGVVDLLVEEDDGLVVVDYRTDRVSSALDAEILAAHYRPQVAAYAAMVEETTGRPVVRCVLLFLDGDVATTDVLHGDELTAAKAAALTTSAALAASGASS